MQKQNKRNKKQNKNKNCNENNSIDLDNEIIIGIKPLPEPKIKNKNNKKNNNKNKKRDKDKNKKKIDKKTIKESKENNNIIFDEILVDVNIKQDEKNDKNIKTKNTKNKKKNKTNSKNKKTNNNKPIKNNIQKNVNNNKKIEKNRKIKKTVLKLFKWTCIFAIITGGISFCLLSPMFNIKKINVKGNSKIPGEEIISLSEIEVDNNIFRIQPNKTIDLIKKNAYVEEVKIKRKLPETINIEITERKPTFIFKFADAYVYINNQGYILEISPNKIEKPIILGIKTKQEDIHVGNRLNVEDLEKLNDVIHIFNTAKSNQIENINAIDISDRQNYILKIDSEKKEVFLGDASNLTTKMLFIKSILDANTNIPGTIFVNRDLSNKGAFFNEEV